MNRRATAVSVEANARGWIDVYLDDSFLFTYLSGKRNRIGRSGVFSGNTGSYFDNFSVKGK